ncbi:hypothetical protein BSKO_11498 [Bryopsis sp. KO-2023]|nr:hypothetical protein BSKO_11498 [Bryopsis sp. KO-2023]
MHQLQVPFPTCGTERARDVPPIPTKGGGQEGGTSDCQPKKRRREDEAVQGRELDKGGYDEEIFSSMDDEVVRGLSGDEGESSRPILSPNASVEGGYGRAEEDNPDFVNNKDKEAEIKNFDSIAQIAVFCTQETTEAGATKLLQILNHPDFDLEMVRQNLKSSRDVNKYVDSQGFIGEGFREHDCSQPSDHQKVTLLYRDPLDALRHLVKTMPSESYKKGKVLIKDDKRVYSGLNTGDWWLERQKRLPYGSIILPLIFYSDSTDLDETRKLTSRPLIMTLGNFLPHHQRSKNGHVL